MWQRKHAGLNCNLTPTGVYCREHFPNYVGVIGETANGPEGFIPPAILNHVWPEPPTSVEDEDMGLKPFVPDGTSPKDYTLSVNVVDRNRLNVAPQLSQFCFSRKEVCDHVKKNVQINNLSDYVIFPSKCFRQGYYNDASAKIVVQAQLFGDVLMRLLAQKQKGLDFIESNVNDDMVTILSNDILQNWDTTYSLDHFDTCKDFDGPVDKECTHHIPHTKFEQVSLIKKLVKTFSQMLPYLPIDLVWLIIKSKPGSGFQSWHGEQGFLPKREDHQDSCD